MSMSEKQENKMIEDIENTAGASRFIGTVGVVMGAGAVAVALVNACQEQWGMATVCALAGAFSATVGTINLKNARDTFARVQELRNKQLAERWGHDWY